VLASRQASTRRNRSTIGAITFALGVAIVLAIVALAQRATAIHERNVAQAGQLDAKAQTDYATAPEAGLALATQAARLTPDAATEAALREALAHSHVRVRYELDQPAAGDALWSPDGTRLLVTSPGLWARIYRPESGTPPLSLPTPPGARGESAWDARGDRVVIGGHPTAVYDARTGALVRRLPGVALAAALTADGSKAISVGPEGVGHVFEVATGRLLASFHPAYRGGATCFALSPDGRLAAQCDAQSLATPNSLAALDTWDVQTGRVIRSVPSGSLIGSVAFSPDGRRYVFTNEGSSPPGGPRTTVAAQTRAEAQPGTFVYDTGGGGPPVITFPGAASAAAFGPTPGVPELAYATLTGPAVHVWNFNSHTDTELIGQTDAVDSISFSHGGAFVVTGSRDDTARVYNAVAGGPAVEVLAGDIAPIRTAAFGLDDEAISTASEDGSTRVWTSPIPRPSLTTTGAGVPPATLAFNASGSRIIDVSETGKGELLDAHDLRVLTRFSAPAGRGFAGARVDRSGRFVYAVSGPYNPRVLGTTATAVDTYNARTGRLIATMPATPTTRILASLDQAGDRIVTLGESGAGSEWDPRTGKLLHQLAGTGIPGAAAFSADGSELAIVHYPPVAPTVTVSTHFGPVKIDLWDPRTGRLLRTIIGDLLSTQVPGTATYPPLTMAFSPDGRLLAAGAAAGAYVWRLPAYTPSSPFQQVPAGATSALVGGGLGVSVGFTADSSGLISAGANTVEAWDLGTHLQLASLAPDRGTLNPAGTTFVAANGGGVSLYPCDLCGGLQRLMAVARAHTP
jgi:WD40 repeat protein